MREREPRRPDTTFWVDPLAVEGEILTLDREESRHLLRVHRARVGARFEAVDGAGCAYRCVLESIAGDRAVGRIVEIGREEGELPAPIALLVGLPDPGPTEVIVEHAVPLGATRFDFVACERSGRPPLESRRLSRLARIARSSLKQCRRTRLPELRSSPSLGGALDALEPGPAFYADPSGGGLPGAGARPSQVAVSLAVGPPGGFTSGEVDRLRGAGFVPISLGPSRLSTETAALALLASVRNMLVCSSLARI